MPVRTGTTFLQEIMMYCESYFRQTRQETLSLVAGTYATGIGVASYNPTNKRITLDSALTASENEHKLRLFQITSGTGIGQSQTIRSHPANPTTVDLIENFETYPDNSSIGKIYEVGINAWWYANQAMIAATLYHYLGGIISYQDDLSKKFLEYAQEKLNLLETSDGLGGLEANGLGYGYTTPNPPEGHIVGAWASQYYLLAGWILYNYMSSSNKSAFSTTTDKIGSFWNAAAVAHTGWYQDDDVGQNYKTVAENISAVANALYLAGCIRNNTTWWNRAEASTVEAKNSTVASGEDRYLPHHDVKKNPSYAFTSVLGRLAIGFRASQMVGRTPSSTSTDFWLALFNGHDHQLDISNRWEFYDTTLGAYVFDCGSYDGKPTKVWYHGADLNMNDTFASIAALVYRDRLGGTSYKNQMLSHFQDRTWVKTSERDLSCTCSDGACSSSGKLVKYAGSWTDDWCKIVDSIQTARAACAYFIDYMSDLSPI